MKSLIKDLFLKYGFNLTEKQISQFDVFYNFLVQENEKYNLTAITKPDEVILKHFIDSVLPINEIPLNSSLIDVGAGAGFPGIPIKILREDIKLTLLDSLQKRVNFLNELLVKLEISDVKTVHARAEDYVQNNREIYDVSTSRAVAFLPTVAEYLIPYIKKGGISLIYKGSAVDEEIAKGKNAIKILGGDIAEVKNYRLNEIESERNVIIVTKVSLTNRKYPRGKNLPKIKPIE